ncbi:DUF5666 domain-containing protein [Thiogranum longum]|nr:DUF5666 domain-containing protein [Thiogranum longum]
MLIILAGLLSGCGGGSGGGTTAGIGGTGQIASGTITGFGSIFVNGIEFLDIDTATCTIDDSDNTGNCQANLQLGMVVEVTGTVNGTTGNATQVIFDSDVEGAVAGVSMLNPGDIKRTFTVLNTAVQIDSASTKFSGGIAFDTLANDDVVEISGFFDNTGVLQATYVEGKGSLTLGVTQAEIKGIVSAAPAAGAGIGDSFVISGASNITVTIAAGADLGDMPGGIVSNGTLVEVRGTLTSPTTLSANRIEPEDTAIGSDGDDISIEGLITDFVSQSNFRVDGQLVDATTATLNPTTLQLGNGAKVEVEGTISGTTLIADDVEARGNDIKVEATVDAVDAGASTVTVRFFNNTLVIQVDSQTQLEDRTGAVSNMTLSDINVAGGDFLEIGGFVGTGGNVIASELRRDSSANAGDDILQGPVDSWNPGSDVTVLGITFFQDINTEFEDEKEAGISSAAFYNALSTGRNIKVRDDIAADGVADEMDLEN